MEAEKAFVYDVAVIGGCGHVGLPLALTFADCGLRTIVYDTNPARVNLVRAGTMPFREEGAEPLLKRVLGGPLRVTESPELLRDCRILILVIGTPVDAHLNPEFTAIQSAIEECSAYMRDGQTLVLRSTVFPGTSARIQQFLREKGLRIGVAFCPERVAQGNSLREFRALPQIISAFTTEALADVRGLFGRFAADLVEMAPMEAELAKLMTNAWRYIQFATINQFYMIATENGLDFNRILNGCRHKYPRTSGMPGAGFAAGPCLMKDTMQLAAFSHNAFVLGHSAMLINEGLPYHLIAMVKREVNLAPLTAGVLGMAFKAESDDTRDSLSFKLRKLLTLEARRVLCSDPYVSRPWIAPMEQVIAESDVLFIGVPHRCYRGLDVPKGKRIVDPWNCVKGMPQEP